MIGGALDLRVVGEKWDESPTLWHRRSRREPLPLRQFCVVSPPIRVRTRSPKALKEIGRLERTLFTLAWIGDPALRRRANTSLNKGEAHHALKRAVFFHRLEENRDRTFENHSYRSLIAVEFASSFSASLVPRFATFIVGSILRTNCM